MAAPLYPTVDGKHTFNVDGHKIRVARSSFVPKQLGVFACEPIAKDACITWYTGQKYDSKKEVKARMKQLIKEKRKHEADYFMDVFCPRNIKYAYTIDAYVPDTELAQPKHGRCEAAYINHDREAVNCQFQTVEVVGTFANPKYRYRVMIVATKEIKLGEELRLDYGDKYHELLAWRGTMYHYQQQPELSAPCQICLVDRHSNHYMKFTVPQAYAWRRVAARHRKEMSLRRKSTTVSLSYSYWYKKRRLVDSDTPEKLQMPNKACVEYEAVAM